MAVSSNRPSLDQAAASLLSADPDGDSDLDVDVAAEPLVERSLNGFHPQTVYISGKQELYEPKQRPRWLVFLGTSLLLLLIFLIVCGGTLALLMRGNFTRRPIDDHSGPHQTPRKALILASYMAQDTDWAYDVPTDWEIFRYLNDDPNAKYSTPITLTNEAVAYLTFILDEYYRLPDYMIFSHGARASWHQPEPMDWLVDALNLTALDEEQYFSVRCEPGPPTGARMYNLQNASTVWHRPAHAYLPQMWEYFGFGELPTQLLSACCGQFAVTKEAILRRPYTWWERYRSPMFQPPEENLPDLGDTWGFIYEQFWHVAMGKPAFNKIPQDVCLKQQWSAGVICDNYPKPPLGNHVHDIVDWWPIRCHKNTQGLTDWPLNVISSANFSSRPG